MLFRSVETLHIGQNLAIRDIRTYPNVEFLDDTDRVMVTVAAIKEIKVTEAQPLETEAAATEAQPKAAAKDAG